MGYRGASKLDKDVFNTFDVATLLPQTRELYRGALSFFMAEDLVWDNKQHSYIALSADNAKAVGAVSRDNFNDIREAMLQLNFIGLDKDNMPATHTTGKSKELWEKAQQFLKHQSEATTKEDKPEYHLSNIISKICAVHPSYNLFNIFHLTVFQLYDTFFQVGYMRSADLSEQIFSNHGGEKFKFEDWLKPIIKNT